MEILIALVGIPLSIGATWFFSYWYSNSRKPRTSVSIAVENLYESSVRDKHILQKQSTKFIGKPEKWEISEADSRVIGELVEKATAKIVQKFKQNEMYYPELLIYESVLKQALRKAEIEKLKYEVKIGKSYGDRRDESDVELNLRLRAEQARERLKALGVVVPEE